MELDESSGERSCGRSTGAAAREERFVLRKASRLFLAVQRVHGIRVTRADEVVSQQSDHHAATRDISPVSASAGIMLLQACM